MFTVDAYKIVFKRVWHYDIGVPARKSGRYDTKCEIYLCTRETPYFIGIARLHPNDKPDKIVGKKIALFRAMGLYYKKVPYYNAFGTETKKTILHCSNNTFDIKEVRTAIWKAFFEWVSTWPNQNIKENWDTNNGVRK